MRELISRLFDREAWDTLTWTELVVFFVTALVTLFVMFFFILSDPPTWQLLLAFVPYTIITSYCIFRLGNPGINGRR